LIFDIGRLSNYFGNFRKFRIDVRCFKSYKRIISFKYMGKEFRAESFDIALLNDYFVDKVFLYASLAVKPRSLNNLIFSNICFLFISLSLN